ncbi:MAG: GDSL-type esterase/lipase family protein [Oscillospiraceae bacterium]
MSKVYQKAIFSVAHTDMRVPPFNNHGRTLRVTAESNTDAYAISVRFSNRYGDKPLSVGAASLALCNVHGELVPNTLIPLTVGGVLDFVLEPGMDLVSDRVRFPLMPGDTLALNIYYPTDEKVISGNWVGSGALRSRFGNFSADIRLPGPNLVSRFARTVAASDMTVMTTSVAEIIAHSSTPGCVVGCFGDSITQQSNWTAPLSKLLYHTYPGKISVCNLGVSGNRLLANSPPSLGVLNGMAGIDRYQWDLLPLHGLTHAILEIGTNDIGIPGSHGAPDSDLITAQQYMQSMQKIAEDLHSRGVRVYVATLPPRPIARPYTEDREVLRKQINDLLRTSHAFDAILDFDAVLRREDGKPGMREGCALPDGLHPSPYGGLLIAKSINLSLFGGCNT